MIKHLFGGQKLGVVYYMSMYGILFPQVVVDNSRYFLGLLTPISGCIGAGG